MLSLLALTELSRTSNSLRGNPLDFTFVTEARQKMEAHKGLWELMFPPPRSKSGGCCSSARCLSGCSILIASLLINKFVVSRAQEKVDERLQQAVSLARTIPSQDAVLQETLLERFIQQLPVLAKLSSPTLKHKHWKIIFKDLSGLLQSLEQRVLALANTSDPFVLVFSAGLAGELVKVHSQTLNTLLQDSKKPFGRVRSTNELTHPGPGQTTSPEGQLGTQG